MTFLSAMRAKWSAYGNVYSPALDVVWEQIESALDVQAGPNGTMRWPVIPAELGIGKTTCAKLWCSMLPAGRSALVVVRTREQAQEFADDVNAWAGDRRAIALFSPSPALPNEVWLSPEKTRAYQVVVVCHKSYEMGLDEFALDAAHARFEMVHKYGEGARDVVIIDEALDQVAEARVKRSDVPAVLAIVAHMTWGRTKNRHLEARRVLDSVERALREAPVDQDHRQALPISELLALTNYSVAQATAFLDALWKDIRTSPRVKPDQRAFAIGVLDVLRRHLNTRPWTDSKSASSARLLRTPPDARGVVLDATGALNSVYKGRPAEFDVKDVAPVRDYSAVTMYVAFDKGVGKLNVMAKAKDIAARTAKDMASHYGAGIGSRRLLVVLAKDNTKGGVSRAAFVQAFAGAGFAEVAVTNWGRVDGRNEWREFDTLLLASVHYGSSSQDVNAYLAIADLAPNEDTLNAVDEVKLIRRRRVAAQTAQAIGRLRLRTMTTPDGRCEPCDVWVRLPNTDIQIDREAVLASVIAVLPGIVRMPWTAGSRRAPRPGRGRNRRELDAKILAHLDGLPAGTRVEADQVREALGVATSTWGRALQRLASAPPADWTVERPVLSGQGRPSYFTRTE